MKSGLRGRLRRLLVIFGIAGLCLAAMHAPLAVAILGPLGSSFPGMLLVLAASPATAWANVVTLSVLSTLLVVAGGRLNYGGAAIGGIAALGYVGIVTLGAPALRTYQERTGSNQLLYGIALAMVAATVTVSVIALVAARNAKGRPAPPAETATESELSTQQALERQVSSSLKLMGIGTGAGVDSSGEIAVLELLRASFEAPYCVFDVGGNQGQYLNLVLTHLPREGMSVHCFEPGGHTYELLEASLAGIDSSGVALNNIALGATSGEMTLHYNEPGSGLASLTKRRLGHFGIAFEGSESVAVDTVDEYCSRNGIERIDLLKCDVEGHELDVFSGAGGMFRSGSIRMATFEFGGCNIDTRTYFQDFYYFFEDLGMRPAHHALGLPDADRLIQGGQRAVHNDQLRCAEARLGRGRGTAARFS